MKKFSWTIFAILLCGFLPIVSYGELITIGLTGKVSIIDDPCNHFGGQIHTNDTLTGFYSYDTSAPDSEPSDPSLGQYWYYNSPCGVSFTINGFSFKTDSNNVLFKIGIVNNGSDVYNFRSYNNSSLPNGALVDSIGWQLTDYGGTALSSDALLTTAPNLDDWNMDRALDIRGPDIGCENYLIRADITSIVLIPEPATLLLFAFGVTLFKRR